MKIFGLYEYGIDESELKASYSNRKFDVNILLKYFQDLNTLRELSPKERRKIIHQKSRDNLKRLLKEYPNQKYELIGTKMKPRGLSGRLSGEQLFALKNNSGIDRIIVLNALGKRKKKTIIEPLFYSVQGLFAVNIEGFDYTASIRFTEERIILLKAKSLDAALIKAEKEFKEYSNFEYLNSDFRLTRWEFIEIMDIYETDVSEIDDKGTEIYSICRNRKINKK